MDIFLTFLLLMSGKNSVPRKHTCWFLPREDSALRLKAEDPTECTPLNLHSLVPVQWPPTSEEDWKWLLLEPLNASP